MDGTNYFDRLEVETMKIRHTDLHEVRESIAGTRRSWLEPAWECLQSLPDQTSSRFLVAEENGQVRAVLGLRLYWGANGRLDRAIICVLVVDPKYNRRGIGSRLVRFAEGIARVYGCARVEVEPNLENWGGGLCWSGLGYDDPGAGLHKVLRPSGCWNCA
jgi:ribosomal protein S18 acetylase RimI-like enzyme